MCFFVDLYCLGRASVCSTHSRALRDHSCRTLVSPRPTCTRMLAWIPLAFQMKLPRQRLSLCFLGWCLDEEVLDSAGLEMSNTFLQHRQVSNLFLSSVVGIGWQVLGVNGAGKSYISCCPELGAAGFPMGSPPAPSSALNPTSQSTRFIE